MKVLLIADDLVTNAYVAYDLREHGHTVETACNGRDGLFMASDGSHDVLVLNQRLPGRYGVGLVQALRGIGVKAPILFLPIVDDVGDWMDGLEIGGGKYLTTPFAVAELLARMAVLARANPLADEPVLLRIANLDLDLLKQTVTCGGKLIDLHPLEFQLLEYLMRHAGQVVARRMLMEAVQGSNRDSETDSVNAYISRLRSKLRQHGGPELIQTIDGAGYLLRRPAVKAT